VTGEKAWIPLALRANRAGWAVADNISGGQVELDGVAGTSVFKVFDLQIARTGITSKEAIKFGFDPADIVIKPDPVPMRIPDQPPFRSILSEIKKQAVFRGLRRSVKKGSLTGLMRLQLLCTIG